MTLGLRLADTEELQNRSRMPSLWSTSARASAPLSERLVELQPCDRDPGLKHPLSSCLSPKCGALAEPTHPTVDPHVQTGSMQPNDRAPSLDVVCRAGRWGRAPRSGSGGDLAAHG